MKSSDCLVKYEHLTAYENLSIHLEYIGAKADINKILSLVGAMCFQNPLMMQKR